MDDFTITTIYFDGQFWCAFIQKRINGDFYSGRYVFGSEPSKPRLLDWMLHEYASVPLYKTEVEQKIRIKDYVKHSDSRIPKSYNKFKEAQKEYFQQEKIKKNKLKRAEQKIKYKRR